MKGKTKKRVKLCWNRNNDGSTMYYRVYRSEKSGVTRNSKLIMIVKNPQEENWVKVYKEKPKRISNIRYKLQHDSLRVSTPVYIYVNGEYANHLVKEINYIDGEIVFGVVLKETDEVTVDYEFDGIEVIDDDIEQELVHQYFGPPAEDKSMPTTPEQISIIPLHESNGVKVSWLPSSVLGQEYYYRIEATDGLGNFSSLSDEIKFILDGGMYEKGYVVERSIDNGKTWRIVSQIPYTEYYEFGIDTLKPSKINIESYESQLITNESKAKVYIQISPYEDTEEAQPSPIYRVYSRSSYGNISKPTVIVGPVYIKVPVEKIVVVRHTIDELSENEIPTPLYPLSKVKEIADLSETMVIDEVEDNKSYRYAIFAVDKTGEMSMGSTFDISIGNATPPIFNEEHEIKKFQIMI
ncbi:MAG: hypothetical protein N2043_02075 [Ignavibacterium sp.]|nr:hypothetical protein [Ignavibacterium sp.]